MRKICHLSWGGLCNRLLYRFVIGLFHKLSQNDQHSTLRPRPGTTSKMSNFEFRWKFEIMFMIYTELLIVRMKSYRSKNIDQTAPFALNFSSKNFVIIPKAKKIYENHQTKTKFENKLYRVIVYSFIVWNFNISFVDILTLKLIFVPKISEPFLRGFRNRHWDLLVHEKLIFLAA